MCPCRDATDLVIPSITNTVDRRSLNMLCGPCELVDNTLHTLACPKSAARSVCSGYRMPPQHRTNVLATMVVPKGDYLDHIDDDDHIEWQEDPYMASASSDGSTDALLNLISFGGTDELQGRLRSLCNEFIDIFCETVRTEPAAVPPMKLSVNPGEWKTNKNRGPPRLQSHEKQNEIQAQVATLLRLGVIEPSSAAEYSHVHLVKKPTPN
jgi:hypothetical protein